ncbi:Methyltransferase type 12 [Penicillium sp. IBT 16267x]|nr:Methyltransferase type 12 [Penicillium sp. IBT 16267x]
MSTRDYRILPYVPPPRPDLIARGIEEAKRLNDQYDLFTEMSDNALIHGEIPKDNITAIADINIGTGIWLQDVAKSFPDTQSVYLHGFDISNYFFPDGNVLSVPGRDYIPLTRHDARAQFRREHFGRYDLVHIHLLGTSLPKKDYAAVLKNVRQILKSTGHIQWEEIDLFPILPRVKSCLGHIWYYLHQARLVQDLSTDPHSTAFLEMRDSGFEYVRHVRYMSCEKEHLHDQAAKWFTSTLQASLQGALLTLEGAESEDEVNQKAESLIEGHCKDGSHVLVGKKSDRPDVLERWAEAKIRRWQAEDAANAV